MTVVAITGASGYLGSLLTALFTDHGATVVRFVRSPQSESDRPFVLGSKPDPSAMDGVDVLIHAAYDMRVIDESDVWKVNVGGTGVLLEAAQAARVPRIVVLSSMSAYEGTKQLYGRAKLAIEADAGRVGAVIVRPGLVVGAGSGGMAGTLAKLTGWPVCPTVGSAGHQFVVSADDFARAVHRLATMADPPTGRPLGVAARNPVRFDDLLRHIAGLEGHREPLLVPVPWPVILGVLRLSETLRLRIPLRSDSLLGLLSPPASVPGLDELAAAGIHIPDTFSPQAPNAKDLGHPVEA